MGRKYISPAAKARKRAKTKAAKARKRSDIAKVVNTIIETFAPIIDPPATTILSIDYENNWELINMLLMKPN
jgi:hypothetical protein